METEVLAPAGRAEAILDRLVAINKFHNDLVLENGQLLKEYKENTYFKADGFKTFDEAIDQLHERGLLDYGARNARHFIAIVDMVQALNLSPEEIRTIGVSKLREIAAVKDESEQRRLLGEAEDKTVGEVQREAKAIRDKAAGRDVDPLAHPITLSFTESQYEFYKQCIAKGRAIGGITEKVPDVVVLCDVVLADWFAGAPDGEV